MATSEDDAAQAQDRARDQVSGMNLPPDLLAKYRKKFDALDLNKDGIVTLREFASVSRVFGYNLTREEILVCDDSDVTYCDDYFKVAVFVS